MPNIYSDTSIISVFYICFVCIFRCTTPINKRQNVNDSYIVIMVKLLWTIITLPIYANSSVLVVFSTSFYGVYNFTKRNIVVIFIAQYTLQRKNGRGYG